MLLVFSSRKFSFLYSSTEGKTKLYVIHYLERFLQKGLNYILEDTMIISVKEIG